MNPLLERLKEPFPRDAVKQRVGGGNRRFDYVEAHSVINRLNNVLDYWDFSILSLDWKDDVLIAHVEINVPGVGRRQHIGVQRLDARAGEDTIKGAVSDALKKCATLFGVAIELYGENYEQYEETPREPEVVRPVETNEERRQRWLSLHREFIDLCGDILGEDISEFTMEETREFISGIMGGDYRCASPRPAIGDFNRVIAKMKEQAGK